MLLQLGQPNRESNEAQLPCPNRVTNSGGRQLPPLSLPKSLSSLVSPFVITS